MDSYFEKGIRLKGTLWVKGSVHFNGEFEGEIYSSDHFIVGNSGKILGNIKTSEVTNMGFIQGNLFAENKVSLMNGSRLTGDLSTYHLVVEESSNFEGRCKMIDEPPKSVKEEIKTLERPTPKVAKLKKNSSETKSLPSDSISVLPLKKIAGIVVFILVIAGLIGVFYKEESVLEPILEKAYGLIAEKKYADAESTFNKALEISRVEPRVYAGLGEVYFEQKKYNDALAKIQRAIDLRPSNVKYRVKQAKIYSSKGQFKDALESYKQAVKIDPKNGAAYYNLGLLYLEKKDIDKAREYFEMSLSFDEDSFEPHEALSRIYSQKKMYDKAVVEINEAIRLRNNEPSLHLSLGALLLKSDKENQAENVFTRAADLFPQSLPVQMRIADWYYTRRVFDKSLEAYKVAEALNSNNQVVQFRIGKLYIDKNENVKAKKAFEKSIKLNPKDAQSHYQLGKLHSRLGEWGRAQSLLSNSISLDSAYGLSHYELGIVLMGRGEVDSAKEEFQKALNIDPENPDFIIGMVNALVEKNQLDQSLNLLLPTSKKESNNAKVFYAICNVYTKKRFLTIAIQNCEKSLEFNKDNHDTMNRLAWLYSKKNVKLEEAFDLSSKTLVAFPDRPEFIDTLSEIFYVRGETKKAIENIKKAINLVPNEPYYKKQLWKFKNTKYKAP